MKAGVLARETPQESELLRSARAAAAVAATLGERHDRDRRLAPELVETLRESGLMRCGAPRSVGAAEAAPAVALESAETLARADAASGWCVSIALTGSLLAGYLPEKGATEVFGDPRAVAAGVWAPRGRARRVEGGLVVNGRWAFCSGITHANHFFGGCLVDGGEGEDQQMRLVGIPVDELEVLDTWHTVGLRGTGSHDAEATEVFVPDHRIASLADGPRVDAPLYRFPILGYFALCIAVVALGNARGAIEDLVELSGGKKAFGSRRTLAEKTTTQAAVAQAEAELRAARAFFYSAVEDAWQAALAGEAASIDHRVGIRLAAAHAAQASARVVRTMYDLGSGSAIYETSPLQRRMRDAGTATAHLQVGASMWELTGRFLLGLPSDSGQL